MANLLRDIWAFISAVAVQWVALMGGLIMTALYLYERSSDQDIPGRLYWSLIVLFVAIATFLAWRKEHERWARVALVPLSLSPKEMATVYQGRTSVHAEELAKVYRGKFLRVTGKVRDVNVSGFDIFTIFNSEACRVSLDSELGDPAVFLGFSFRWKRSLSALQRGEEITVLGYVHSVTNIWVSLRNCELVQIAAAAAAPSAPALPEERKPEA